MSDKRDVAIIGAGPAGYAAAIRLSQLGFRARVIDVGELMLGGTCLNEGCVPVKSLMNSALVFSACRKADIYGLEADAKKPDMKRLIAASHNALAVLRSGLRGLFKKNGIEFICGKASILSDSEIEVRHEGGRKKIEAGRIIIASGSIPRLIPNAVLDGRLVITSRDVFKMERLPRTMLVVGAGAIGLEFASLFSLLGVDVTIIEALPRILPSYDEEASRMLERILKKKGIKIFTRAEVKSLNKKGQAAEAVLELDGAAKTSEFDCVLIAVGRRPNIDAIGLEAAAVAVKDGFVVVDSRMRTSIKNIYAAGDVLNAPMYAHAAYKEGIIAAEAIAGIRNETVDYSCIPHIAFSEPQAAAVGLTELQAKENGYHTVVSKHFFKANSKAVLDRSEDGFIKIIADKKSKKLLGVFIIGPGAAEIIHEFILAKNAALTVCDIANAVHAHPTLSEIAQDAAKAVFSSPIHG